MFGRSGTSPAWAALSQNWQKPEARWRIKMLQEGVVPKKGQALD